MDFKDYYKSLGLEKGADKDAVKKAYRKLAAKYHPDKNPGNKAAEDRFKEINEANEVLSDPEKRKQYDELGANWNQGNQAGHGGPFSGGGAGGSGRGRSRNFSQDDMEGMFGGGDGGGRGGFSDFFETFFGGAGVGGGAGPGRGRQGGTFGGFQQVPRQGNDYQADVEITLEEAFQGAKKIIEIDGKKLRLQFKPGISDGKAVKLQGKGGKGVNGGPDGDFYIRIHVQPHARFERREDDLHMVLPLQVQDAITGLHEEIDTLGGSVKLRIPAETGNGKVFRLKGQGMPNYDAPATLGDLYVTVSLALPEDLTAEETAFFKRMAESRRK